MANHKRGKPKNARAGCLGCKPHKMNGASIQWRFKASELRQIERGKWEIREYS